MNYVNFITTKDKPSMQLALQNSTKLWMVHYKRTDEVDLWNILLTNFEIIFISCKLIANKGKFVNEQSK